MGEANLARAWHGKHMSLQFIPCERIKNACHTSERLLRARLGLVIVMLCAPVPLDGIKLLLHPTHGGWPHDPVRRRQTVRTTVTCQTTGVRQMRRRHG
jgi:hypothetical protein